MNDVLGIGIPEDVINGMKVMVEWNKLKDFCNLRTNCKDCPYFKHRYCSSVTTEAVMKIAESKFREFLLRHDLM